MGKSFLIERVLDSWSEVVSLNLEVQKSIRLSIDNCQDFFEFEALLREHGLKPEVEQILFIDEAQESEQIGSFVRSMKERWRNTRCVLSGSSMTRIFRDDQRIPVGRFHRLLLEPLSFHEFLSSPPYQGWKKFVDDFSLSSGVSLQTHEKLLGLFDEYLQTGGLPEVVTSYLNRENYQLVRREILASQEEDFIRKSGIEKQYLFLQGLRAVANHIGGPSTYSHFGEALAVSKEMIKNLCNWKIVHEIPQVALHSTASLYPKRYLYDLGIAQIIRAQPFPQLSVLKTRNSSLRTELGGLFENAALIALKEFKMGAAEISGFKDGPGNSAEVDFIVKFDQRFIPVECKASLKNNRRSFTSLKIYLRKTGLKMGVLVSATPFQVFTEGGFVLVNVPIYLLSVPFLLRLSDEYS